MLPAGPPRLRDESRAALLSMIAAGVVLVVHTALIARGVDRTATFVGDDLIDFWRASTLTLVDFVLTPNDLHFVPLHRIVARFALEVAPLDFRAGLALLFAFHLATVVVLYRLAALLAPRSVAVFLVCVYGLNPCLLSMFMWWTSGLHRLGCIFFVTAALYAYVRYRLEGRRAFLVAVAACSAASLGFYEKGLLIPLYMAALDLSLEVSGLARRGPPKRWLPYAVVLAALGLYLIAWRAITPPNFQGMNLDAGFLAPFVFQGLVQFAPTTFGLWLEPEWRTLVPPVLFWVPLIALTIALAPRSAVPWACLLFTVGANMAALGASARSQAYGGALLMADRYYFESAFLVVVFAAVVSALVLRSERVRSALSTRWAPPASAALAASALAFLSVQSSVTSARIRDTLYPDGRVMSDYMRTLRSTLANVPDEDRHPLLLRDSKLARATAPFEHPTNDVSTVLTLMGEDVKVTNRAHYAVARTGKVYPLRDAKPR